MSTETNNLNAPIDPSTMTTEQLEAALAARRVAEARAQLNAKEADRQAEYAKQKAARIARQREIFFPVIAGINAARPKGLHPSQYTLELVESERGDNDLTVRWVASEGYRPLPFNFSERYSSSFRFRGTGTYRIQIGAWGDKISYPQKTDGTFNVAKIAAKFWDSITAAHEVQREATEASRLQASNLKVAALRNRLGLSGYGAFRVDGNPHDGEKVSVRFELNRLETPERVEEIARALASVGLITLGGDAS